MDLCTSMDLLRKTLIDSINRSGLTVGAAYYVVKDVANLMHLTYLEEMDKEAKGANQREIVETYDIPMPEMKEEMENGEQNND